MIKTTEPLRHNGDSYDPGDTVDMTEEEAREGNLIALGIVEVVESLPEDFPGRVALHDAGHRTVESVAGVDELTAIDGIGEKTADDIVRALEVHLNDDE